MDEDRQVDSYMAGVAKQIYMESSVKSCLARGPHINIISIPLVFNMLYGISVRLGFLHKLHTRWLSSGEEDTRRKRRCMANEVTCVATCAGDSLRRYTSGQPQSRFFQCVPTQWLQFQMIPAIVHAGFKVTVGNAVTVSMGSMHPHVDS